MLDLIRTKNDIDKCGLDKPKKYKMCGGGGDFIILK